MASNAQILLVLILFLLHRVPRVEVLVVGVEVNDGQLLRRDIDVANHRRLVALPGPAGHVGGWRAGLLRNGLHNCLAELLARELLLAPLLAGLLEADALQEGDERGARHAHHPRQLADGDLLDVVAEVHDLALLPHDPLVAEWRVVQVLLLFFLLFLRLLLSLLLDFHVRILVFLLIILFLNLFLDHLLIFRLFFHGGILAALLSLLLGFFRLLSLFSGLLLGLDLPFALISLSLGLLHGLLPGFLRLLSHLLQFLLLLLDLLLPLALGFLSLPIRLCLGLLLS
mmetsp:Transcript_4590/g.9999  ORF Transcript_4590/g.9999 Transcript_4590/m.9999 type:complete len:284 (+) Transcript_4590:1048-1899(+)